MNSPFDHGAPPPGEPALKIEARPFVWRDPAQIPARQWLYGRHYVRKFVSLTAAMGGVGKSSLSIAEALSMASGLALLGTPVPRKLRVWLWNGEDPYDELERRLAATALHHNVDPHDFEGRLFLNSGRETELVIAQQDRNGARIMVPVVDALIAEIRREAIDVLIVDPFVSSHRVPENDNGAIDAVAKTWARVADATNCAVELVHHVRKTNGAEVTVEDGRGAVALLSAARSARVLNAMTEDEAARAGVENRRSYFRVDNGKANLAPPADRSEWYGLKSVDLGNGDWVGVVVQWCWPDMMANVQVSDLRAVQSLVAAGKWRENPQAKDWVGRAVAKVLGLDADSKAHRAKISSILKIWIAAGMFVLVEGRDEARRLRTFVEVGTWAND